ncbi:MAG: sulfite exporter TauE/SafE family protein, partial [Vulcanimicrobiaceae bacterium]
MGVAVGFLGGLFGLGGGLFVIPVLGFVYNFDQQHAQGTALAMIIPNTIIAIWQYFRRNKLDLRVAATLAASALPLTYLAAHVATHTASTPLRRSFAVFMLVIAAYYLWLAFGARHRTAPPQPHPERWPAALAIGAAGGAMSGMFSTGGAVFAVPLVAAIFGVSQAAAQGLGLALVGPGTFVSLGIYAAAGDVVWHTGIALAIGGIVAIGWGVHL